MKGLGSVWFLFFLVLTESSGMSRNVFAQEPIQLGSDTFSLHISADGLITGLVDRATGTNYVNQESPGSFAVLKSASGACYPKTASYDGKQLVVDFGEPAGQVTFIVTAERRRLVFEVASVSWADAEELVFAGTPLTLKGDLSEPFGVSPLALNLKTDCHTIPGLNSSLSGFIAYKRFGFAGARGTIVACPVNEMRDALKDAVMASPDLARSPLGGPWALDAAINQGSYLIAMDEYVTEDNADNWVAAARLAGATQIDFHGGKAFRWGDYEVNREIYPQGRASLKAAVDKVHQAGMAAGLHTYAFFIAKDSPWVTPIPDPRLATDATFTVAEDISDTADVIPVVESTASVSVITGFLVRNSVTLRLDDELITFADVEKQAPYGFRGCVRGAYGTSPAPHRKGTPAYRLKECFGLFVPQGDSSLFTEVARRTADLYNECGFDMLYLDALDGSDILEGRPCSWHYEAVFVDELLHAIQKPAVMEMSTFSHHLWRARSRMQAWDCAQRNVKAFVDCHVTDNMRWQRSFMPTHLGWWGSFEWSGLQPERTFPDNLEYVYAKALATDSSLSHIVGFSPAKLDNGNMRRLGAIAQRYEELRARGSVSETIKKRLAAPGRDFTLEMLEDGQAQFRPVEYSKHSLTLTGGPETFSFNNPHAAQPLRLRIEVGLAPAPYDSSAGVVLTDFMGPEEFQKSETQEGVTASLNRAKGVQQEAVLTAQNTNVESDRAWASFAKEFSPYADLTNMSLGLWVTGDGRGEVLNIQLRSPMHLAGGFADHYIHVDFTGPRYFQLVEPESEALGTFEWAHTRKTSDMVKDPSGRVSFLYSMYHVWMAYSQVASLTVGVNNLPPNTEVRLGMGPIKALPLDHAAPVNPSITISGRTLTFPVELASGSYLEYLGPDTCNIYDGKGECLGNITPEGSVPEVNGGDNTASLACDSQSASCVMAKVTVILSGEPLCQ